MLVCACMVICVTLWMDGLVTCPGPATLVTSEPLAPWSNRHQLPCDPVRTQPLFFFSFFRFFFLGTLQNGKETHLSIKADVCRCLSVSAINTTFKKPGISDEAG
ncbi:hypothetical protein AMECASPLE_001236 [Ameca splendens]|uniref:Secreted protein n=1 Tax=Ameca splendens TaxID=208324 RepID=A0ABV0YL58_9TELE